MKINLLIIILFLSFVYSNVFSYVLDSPAKQKYSPRDNVIIQQVPLDANNINSFILNTGIFNQDRRTSNTPGFEWPKYSHSEAIFTTGINIAATINNQIRMAAASYAGEYAPGYIIDSSGQPVARTDSRFKIYSVKSTDSYYTNPDWLNWGLMIPYGAPFVDVNHNGTYEPAIDTPGVSGASQTIFVCLTDGFPWQHSVSEGFGGGTLPVYAELHLTAWCFDSPLLQDVQFLKWKIINKNNLPWSKTYFAFFCDADLGCSDDDLIGCDTSLGLAFCYNGEEVDCNNPYRYSGVVPAIGIDLLEGAVNKNSIPNIRYGMTSFAFCTGSGAGGPVCERDPNPNIPGAYNYIMGSKLDETPWVVPPGGPTNKTKFVYSGDPETGSGWNEAAPGYKTGSVQNCGGPMVTTGNIITVNAPGDRRFFFSSGAEDLTVNPGDTQTIAIAEIISRGSNRRNSVTELKNLTGDVRNRYLISVHNDREKIPDDFFLYQNFPNPFNPKTEITFQLSITGYIDLSIFDVTGRLVKILTDGIHQPGFYKVELDGSFLSSGVYFYKLNITGKNISSYITKKMILLK